MVTFAARYFVSFCLAVLVAFGLFYLMQSLVAEGDADIKKVERMRVVDFVRLRSESVVQKKKRERPQRPKSTEQPTAPVLKMPQPSAVATNVPAMKIAAPTPDVDVKIKTGPRLGPAPTRSSDAEEMPLVRVKPQYPRIAQQDGIEGWVRVRFDVNPAGQVVNPVVIAAKPMNIFEQAALHAVKRWKYRPKIENGVAVARRGMVTKLIFELGD